jgi:hypothetical protein
MLPDAGALDGRENHRQALDIVRALAIGVAPLSSTFKEISQRPGEAAR